MASSDNSGGFNTSDIIGIAVGIPSGVFALVAVIISFCAWRYPNTRIGKVGTRIGKQFSVRGGDARGGDATGPGAHGGNAVGGNAYADKHGHDRIHQMQGTLDTEAQYGTETKGGSGRGGDAYGNYATGGSGQGGPARGEYARGGDGYGGAAIGR